MRRTLFVLGWLVLAAPATYLVKLQWDRPDATTMRLILDHPQAWLAYLACAAVGGTLVLRNRP